MMGWKNVKEHYRVQHTVQVTDEGICIGSPYIHNIIVIGADGKVKKPYGDGRSNEDLRRIQDEIDADLTMLRKMVLTADTFDKSITVYTYDGCEIIECKCEELEWPNVTHGGSMMYENTFSSDKSQVVKWAKRNAELGVKWAKERVDETEKQLHEYRERLAKEESDLAKLGAEFPESV
jgi:hypothetical protein